MYIYVYIYILKTLLILFTVFEYKVYSKICLTDECEGYSKRKAEVCLLYDLGDGGKKEFKVPNTAVKSIGQTA